MVAAPAAWTRGKHALLACRVVACERGRASLAIAWQARSVGTMDTDPDQLMAVVVAMIGGIAAFSALLLLGGWVVRILRLPQDLPDGPRFEPPPPPVAALAERTAARLRAERQAEVHALYARIQELVRTAHECQLLSHQLQDEGVAAEVMAALTRHAAEAETASTQLMTAMATANARHGQQGPPAGLDELRGACDSAGKAIDAAIAAQRAIRAQVPLPSAPTRRWLLLLLAIMVLWLVALITIIRH